MNTQRPPTIDPLAADRWAALAGSASEGGAATTSPWLHEEVARRMEERLQWIVKEPRHWLHWQALRGGLQGHQLLRRRYPKALCYLLQEPPATAPALRQALAQPWWSAARWKNPPRLHAPPEPVDLVWANMALHMAADPQALINRWYELLQTDGFLMFSCLGPDTLAEVRTLYAQQGWGAPSHEFTDMHDWGDMLVQAGFAEPVMDMERITLNFSSPQTLLAELRTLGRNLHPQRFAGLRGRAWRRGLEEALARTQADPSSPGRLRLRFEIIYGHAFKPSPRIPVQAQTTISLDQMRDSLRQHRAP